ncbi:MAG TPA: DUF11 domain-containing protein [Thermoanaerobaculia bacterium]|nr:DUF11 domain-containing protein [Thermoanaerobaculia bacterium]
MSIEINRESSSRSLRNTAVAVLFLIACSGVAMAAPVIIYSSIPAPLPPNVPSEPFQAGHAAEFGDLVQFAGTIRGLTHVTFLMSDHAQATDFPSFPGASGPSWNYPLTLNLYNVDNSGGNPPQPGTLIATRTQTFAIPWRPAPDPTCSDPTRWRASDGNCYTGVAFLVTFDFTGTTVPNQIIYGLAFNTQTFGANPVGSPGPYDSLNAGLAQVPPTIGSNPFPDNAFLNSPDNSGYNDGGAGGTGTFRRDPSTMPTPSTTWAPFSGAISFEVGVADVAVTKNGPGIVAAGSNISYSVTVTNNGGSDAQTATLTDTLPAGTTFVSESQGSGPAFICTNPSAGGTGSVSCTIATLASGASATFTLVFNVNANAAGTTLSNTATVSSPTNDPVSGNNSATSTANVVAAAQLPTLSQLSLMLLALAVSLIAVTKLRL